MAMGVESREIPKGLDGDDGAGECILLRNNGLEKRFRRVPCTSAEIGEQLSVIEKISAKDLEYTENEMTVRYSLEHVFTEPFSELYLSLLMAGRAEVAALTREG